MYSFSSSPPGCLIGIKSNIYLIEFKRIITSENIIMRIRDREHAMFSKCSMSTQ